MSGTKVHTVTTEEPAVLETKARKRPKTKEVELHRPRGGEPELGSEVKIVHCGTRWAVGSFGTVIKMEPFDSPLGGHDAILTVRVTLTIGPDREHRRVTVADVVCFARHVEVHQPLKEIIADVDEEEEVTEEIAERVMQQGLER